MLTWGQRYSHRHFYAYFTPGRFGPRETLYCPYELSYESDAWTCDIWLKTLNGGLNLYDRNECVIVKRTICCHVHFQCPNLLVFRNQAHWDPEPLDSTFWPAFAGYQPYNLSNEFDERFRRSENVFPIVFSIFNSISFCTPCSCVLRR